MMIVEGTRIKQPVQTAREDTGYEENIKTLHTTIWQFDVAS